MGVGVSAGVGAGVATGAAVGTGVGGVTGVGVRVGVGVGIATDVFVIVQTAFWPDWSVTRWPDSDTGAPVGSEQTQPPAVYPLAGPPVSNIV